MYKGIWIALTVILSLALIVIVILDMSGMHAWTEDALHVFIVATILTGVVDRFLRSKKRE